MKIIHFDSIDSTNTYLLNHYTELENFTIVRSDVQTAGKGRNQRKWISENGSNLLFSLLIRDKEFFANFGDISIISAYSVMSVLLNHGINNASIKWPNDVYAGERKICGILLQSVSRNEMECLVVGVGINVNQKVFEGDYLHAPTSVCLETGYDMDLEFFSREIFETLLSNLDRLKEGFDFFDAISGHDYLKGKECYCEILGEVKKVRVAGIAKDFQLNIEDAGVIRSVRTGEITFHL